jgi:hypothetical protein
MADLMRASLLAPLLALAAPAVAAPLTMHVGETWIFAIRNGQPSAVRKVTTATNPAKGQVRASVSALGGTTMVLTNATGLAYKFRAELIGSDGKAATARSCTLPAGNQQAFESWQQRAVAVRIGAFKRTDDPGKC